MRLCLPSLHRSSLIPFSSFPEAYRRYLVSGTFLHALELPVGPRAAPPSVHGPAQGLGTNPQGFYILTPFRRDGDGYVQALTRGGVGGPHRSCGGKLSEGVTGGEGGREGGREGGKRDRSQQEQEGMRKR
jgi:hypothetical protein